MSSGAKESEKMKEKRGTWTRAALPLRLAPLCSILVYGIPMHGSEGE